MPIVIAIFIIIGSFLAGNSIVNHQVKSVTTKIETSSPSPTSMPTPTPVPEVKINQITPPPYDPIVDCGTDYQRQKGTTVKAKKSICDSWIDCNLGVGVAVRVPKEKCEPQVDCQIGGKVIRTISSVCEQAKSKVSNDSQSTVNCQTQSGWVRMSQDDCKKVNADWANQLHDELNNQFKIQMYQDLEQESKIDSTLDQLDNLRERIRHIQTSSPEEQNYVNTLIRFIEARIKILQQQ